MHNSHSTFITKPYILVLIVRRFDACHSSFITMPYILVLVVRRFDACLRKLTTKIKGTAFLKIAHHDYKLNSLIEHHGEI